ncbi:MAG: bifunctional methylenetetrahydrofolate dehydrogenase/methenyltetrahydrofolate cyclohydrolase FolD [Pseudomonadota bacterium]
MTAALIDGKAYAAGMTDKLATAAAAFTDAVGAKPYLAVILVGEDAASAIYVRNKGRTAEKIGFRSITERLPADAPQQALVDLVTRFNDDPSVHGILVQLPLPDQMDASAILELISPEKDVDGFHPMNVGRLGAGEFEQALAPCTPAGSVLLAKSARDGDLSGLHTVILGRSNIVGKPAAQLFLAQNCTVTIAHSRTKDLPEMARQADILVAAVGRPHFVKGDWVKPGATVIDVGINRLPPADGEEKGKVVGDVDFEAASKVAGAITPVPGGVGPMTIAMLMANTLTAACRQAGRPDLDVSL